MVCNVHMETSTEQIEADARLIQALGGPAKVATMLGWANPGGQRRVTNWRKRGIPPAVKLKYPLTFLVGMQAAANQLQQPAALPSSAVGHETR